MGFVESIQTCFSKYFDFNGRARRSEYWYFVLFITLASIVLGIVEFMVFGMPSDAGALGTGGFFESPLSNIFSLATFIPSISAASRRLHDIGRSGWFQPMMFAPLLPLLFMTGGGAFGGILMVLGLAFIALTILLIVWLATDTHAGHNQYGPSPK